MDATDIETRLRQVLPHDYDIRVRPSAIPGCVDVWVVGGDAEKILWSDLAAESGVGLDNPLFGARYIFESAQEALSSGVAFEPGSRPPPRSWSARAPEARLAETEVDEGEVPSPQITAFYSFKGGVGRSTALAQAALGLVSRGKRVLMIDADLEAPSLHYAFGISKSVSNERSLIAALEAVASNIKYGRTFPIDVRDHILPADASGQLFLMPAGAVDAAYIERLDSLDVGSWPSFPSNPVGELLKRIAESDIAFDAILIDARTGFSDANAPFLLEDVHQYVICFYPSEQTAAGTKLVVQTLIGSTSPGRAPKLRFVASPLPRGSGELIDPLMHDRALTWAYEWQYGEAEEGQLELVAIPYDVAIARTDDVLRDPAVTAAYDRIVDWLDSTDLSSDGIPSSDSTALMRQELRFTDGTGEGALAEIEELFVRTRDTETAERERTLLVMGRKGTGKTTIFLHLLSLGSVAITEPESAATSNWRPVGDTWKAISDTPGGSRLAWPILTAMRLVETRRIAPGKLPEADAWLEQARSGGAATLARVVREFSHQSDAALVALDLLDRTSRALPGPQRVVFDGLDTMFGLSEGDQRIRNEAILGLLTWIVERESAAKNLKFTAFLRTDIWESLSFANQSHLYGRQLVLSWQPSDYLKTALKQAVRSSPTFSDLVDISIGEVDSSSEERVIEAWRELCGTRVRGAGTSFTDRWVWSRLRDGNGDHSPRYLIQLCASLLESARARPREEGGPPLRGRDFGPVLESIVSQQAWRAAKEEYPSEEMSDLEDAFRRLTLTPFSAEDWERAGGSVALRETAITFGLLAPHPREEGRWVVPELYRYAVGVARRGPA